MRWHERPDVVSSRPDVVKPPVAFTVLARRRGNGPARAEQGVQRSDVPRETVDYAPGIRFHASPRLQERAPFMLGEDFEEGGCLGRRSAALPHAPGARRTNSTSTPGDPCGADRDHDGFREPRYVEAPRTCSKLELLAGRRPHTKATCVAIHVSRDVSLNVPCAMIYRCVSIWRRNRAARSSSSAATDCASVPAVEASARTSTVPTLSVGRVPFNHARDDTPSEQFPSADAPASPALGPLAAGSRPKLWVSRARLICVFDEPHANDLL